VDLDQIDRRILALLSKNARSSNKELAAEVGLSASTAHERTKRLIERGLIAGSHAEIRLDLLGLSLRALLFVQLSEHQEAHLDHFIEEVLHMPEVRAAWMITGRFDAVVEVATRDTGHLHRLVVERFSSREDVYRIETSIIFEGGRQMDVTTALDLTR